MRGPADFGAAFTALLEVAGANPDSVVRALNGALSRNTLYDWKKGAHLPNDTRSLLQVVQLCLRLAGDDADLRGAPRDVRGWLDLLAEAKQTRDNQAAAAGRGLHRASRRCAASIRTRSARQRASWPGTWPVCFRSWANWPPVAPLSPMT